MIPSSYLVYAYWDILVYISDIKSRMHFSVEINFTLMNPTEFRICYANTSVLLIPWVRTIFVSRGFSIATPQSLITHTLSS